MRNVHMYGPQTYFVEYDRWRIAVLYYRQMENNTHKRAHTRKVYRGTNELEIADRDISKRNFPSLIFSEVRAAIS